MNKSNKVALAAGAAGVLLLAGAGIAMSTAGVINVSQHQWANLIVAIGLIGYAAAICFAAFAKRGPRHASG
jgi:putative Ca2+/H+ antiporter (TMEM165/GDT1 family)